MFDIKEFSYSKSLENMYYTEKCPHLKPDTQCLKGPVFILIVVFKSFDSVVMYIMCQVAFASPYLISSH